MLGGELRKFAFLGDGTFVQKTGFGFVVRIDETEPGALGWPEWLPIRITEIGVQWRDFNQAPGDFKLIVSAAVTGMKFLENTGGTFSITGAVSGVIIDPQLLLDGKFPITGIGALAVSVQAGLPGASIKGSLMGGIIRVDNKIGRAHV